PRDLLRYCSRSRASLKLFDYKEILEISGNPSRQEIIRGTTDKRTLCPGSMTTDKRME
ncbi:hypothetical protein CEXT_790451, partial [Caerostris extrusa]